MYRLAAYAHSGVQRFAVRGHQLVIGSRRDCDVVLAYPGVAPRHARLHIEGDELRIEDLGSSKGLLVNGRRVQMAPLQVLDEIRIGGVTLLVEDLPSSERELDSEELLAVSQPITASRFIDHLARLSDWVLGDTESRVTLESLVRRLLVDCGGGAMLLFLLGEEDAEPAVRFALATDPEWLSRGDQLLATSLADRRRQTSTRQSGAGPLDSSMGGMVETQIDRVAVRVGYRLATAVERRYVLIAAFPAWTGAGFEPVAGLGVLADLLILGLVHHVGRYEPILPGARARRSLVLPPGFVIGETPAMTEVVTQLTAAIEQPVNVLLRGEPGTGKTALARILHDSGPWRDGPFVVALAAGGDPARVAADLFGAEVPGKTGPVQREGKLRQAHGGTLLLVDVDQLSLESQARLVRFLRSGEVEPLGGRGGERSELRIVATTRRPLEPMVARDRFRVDLAQRLAQVAIDVPPLRTRREDLPLLIQTFLNRFCHESGKRVQGISVRAMTGLTSYDYPGNLLELENLVRQVVTLCPPGQPIDAHLLPARVTAAHVRLGPRIDAVSELDLERLVGVTEGAAIREALRRSAGNKAQAARLLGLSRNGLAMKMVRLGLSD